MTDHDPQESVDQEQAMMMLRIMHEGWRNQPECMIMTDENLQILLCNDTTYRDLNFEPEEMVGQSLAAFIEADEALKWEIPAFPADLEEDTVMQFPAAICAVKTCDEDGNEGPAVPVDLRLSCFICGDEAPALKGQKFMVWTMRDLESMEPALMGMMGQMPPEMMQLMNAMAAGGMPPGAMPPGAMPPGAMPPGAMPPGGPHPGMPHPGMPMPGMQLPPGMMPPQQPPHGQGPPGHGRHPGS